MRLPLFATALITVLLYALPAGAQYRFVENGKQWPEQVAFRTDIPGGKFYVERDRFVVDLYDTEMVGDVFSGHSGSKNPKSVPKKLACHAYYVSFSGANLEAIPQGARPFETLYSYFIGSDAEKWSGGLSAFAEVRYPSIYPGIDLKVYSNGALKYDFVIKPGASPDLIKMLYEGVKPKINQRGELVIKTTVGEVVESRPFAYQLVNGAITPVECSYRLSDNEVSYELGAYDNSLELVIDPELIFSTYSGSTADNFGYSATFDAQGHLYAGSSVFGNGYPVTPGAYQATWGGGVGAGTLSGTDIALTKFTLDGTGLIYSTYLGGSGDELPHSLVTNSNGELFVMGTSGSTNFPVTAGAFQSNMAGGTSTILGGIGVHYDQGCDIVISRLNANGSALLGSTYIGGASNDGVNTAAALRFNYADEVRGEIEIDPEGNVVVGSSTYSTDFPMVGSPAQATLHAAQEGVVFKMNPGLTTLLASTFYGGGGNDAVYSIDITDEGITVGGGTTSTNLPQEGSPYQATNGGGRADGYLATFSNDLSTQLNMTYYGSTGYDQIYFIERDAEGNPHIYGQTDAEGNTFISNAAFNIPNSGMLLSKFNPNLSAVTWSTVFGDGVNLPNISPSAFSVDICNRIYLSGWGGAVNNQGSTTGLPVTPDALQSTTDGNDFYFLVMEGDAASLTFASFFGGSSSAEHVDGGTSRFDRGGKMYQAVCAGCGSNDDFPIFPDNAHSPTNNSFNCNLGVAKIDFDLPLVFADFTVETACLPAPTSFVNNSTVGSSSTAFIWDFGDGTTSNLANPSHVYSAPGTYTARLVVWDPATCNLADTLELTIDVYPEISIDIENEVFSCEENDFTLVAGTMGLATNYQWASDSGFQNILLQGPTDSILNFNTITNTTIYVQASAGPCVASEAVQIIPPPLTQLSVGDTLLCQVDTLTVSVLTNQGTELSQYLWQPEELIITGQGTASVTVSAFEPFELSVSAVSQFGCEARDSSQVLVYPVSLVVSDDSLACFDDPVLLEANSLGTSETYQWSSEVSFTNILGNEPTLTVIPQSFLYYYVRVFNNLCSITDSVGIGSLKAGTSMDSDRLVCAGDTVRVSVSNDFPNAVLTYTWEPDEYIIAGQGSKEIVAVVANESVTFTVVSNLPDGSCSTESQMTVFTSPLGELEVTASADPIFVLRGESSILTATPIVDGYTYTWEPPAYLDNPASPIATSTPTETITYTLFISDSNTIGACIKQDQVTISVVDFVCGDPYIYVPNAFTPNGDNENDVLYVRGGNITAMRFMVYDRWGELVFETQDQSQGWDGTFKGRLANPAVFVYHLEVDCGGESYFTKGNVTLIR